MADRTMSDQITELTSNIDSLADKTGTVQKVVDNLKNSISGLGVTGPASVDRITASFDRLLNKVDQYQRALGRVTSASTLNNAANISMSHSILTGGGGGGGAGVFFPPGGGGGGGGGVPGGGAPDLTPLPYPKGLLNTITGFTGGRPTAAGMAGAFGSIASYSARAAFGFGKGYVQQALGSRPSFEAQTRFLEAGSLSGGIGTLGQGTIHGYDAMQTAAQRLAVAQAVGGQSENPGGIGIEQSFQAMGNVLRQDPGRLISAAGTFRAGGLNQDQSIQTLQRIHNTLTQIEGLNQGSPSYMRRSALLLNNLVSLSQQQLAVSGRITQEQVQGMSAALGAVESAGFDPAVSGQFVGNITNAMRGNAGGGPAGEAFIQRVLGLHGSSLEAMQDEARRRGINPELFKERSVFEMQQFRETASEATLQQMMMVGSAVELGGGGKQFESYMLQELTNNPMTVNKALIDLYNQGGFSDAAVAARKGAGVKGAEGLSAVAGADPTAKQFTATGMEMVQDNIRFANQMLEFGGSEAMVTINKTLRTFQTEMGKLTSDAVIPSIREMKKFAEFAGTASDKLADFMLALDKYAQKYIDENIKGTVPGAEAVE